MATRVTVPALGIDLPVMRQPGSYPACNVAMYLAQLKQPGQGGPTYLYAHARSGMFLPLLDRSRVNNGASMIGMRVEVYTGDNKRFVYRIDEVRRHVTDLRYVNRRKGESLWLQTSEGPRGTVPKLQVGASLVSSGSASHAEAHPKPRPVACG
ncbi:MAG TPA: sortase [Vitreimonas sp.]|nr:sortase [Vitreimonas sp.]